MDPDRPEDDAVPTRARRPAVTPKRRVLARVLHGDRLGLAAARRAGAGSCAEGTVLLVYSRASGPPVRRFVQVMRDQGWDVRTWALDEPDPGLRSSTVGVGPGSKYTLLNRLHATLDRTDATVVLADDDVEVVHGSLGDAVGIARQVGLDLYQPAHTYDSVVSWRLTYRRPATVARRTDFVEVGPICMLEPAAAARLFPLDDTVPMSGGIDWSWRRLHHPALRMGIVDAVTMRHLRPLGRTYDRTAATTALRAELARAGIDGDPARAMRTLDSWRAWQAAPSW